MTILGKKQMVESTSVAISLFVVNLSLPTPSALVEVFTIENNRRMRFSSCCQILRSYLFPFCRFSANPISRSVWSAINRGIFSTSPSSFRLSRENRIRSFT